MEIRKNILFGPSYNLEMDVFLPIYIFAYTLKNRNKEKTHFVLNKNLKYCNQDDLITQTNPNNDEYWHSRELENIST
jgi:hypothetical protein